MTAPKVEVPVLTPSNLETSSKTVDPKPPTPSSTETPPAPRTDLDALSRMAIRELGEKNAAQEREIAKLKLEAESSPVAPPVDPAAEQQKFFENPTGSVRAMIKEELVNTVGPMIEPLQDYAAGVVAVSKKDEILALADKDPVLGPKLRVVRPAVLQMMDGAGDDQITPDNVRQAIWTTWGLYSAGQLPANLITNAPTPPAAPTPVTPTFSETPVIPAQITPSAPAPPVSNNPTIGRQYTESERAIARGFGYNLDNPADAVQYQAYLDAPEEVAAMGKFVDAKVAEAGGNK